MKPLGIGRAKTLGNPTQAFNHQVQVYIVWNFLCTCERNDHMMHFSPREHPCVWIFCLSSRPSPRPSTLLCAPRDRPLAFLPFDLSRELEREGEQGQLPLALSLITGLVSPPQVPTSCQMTLSTQHSVSGAGNHSLLLLRGGKHLLYYCQH